MKILGFLDEREALHGRRLRSFRILGGLSMIPELVEEEGLRGVILAIKKPRPELEERLMAMATEYDLKNYRWKAAISSETSPKMPP